MGSAAASQSTRELALVVLMAFERKGGFVKRLIDRYSARLGPYRERRLLNRLVLCTLRHRGYLDWVMSRQVSGYSRLPVPIRNILRLAAAQLRFFSAMPSYAVVSEAVELARRYGHPGTAGLVNAVLRRLDFAEHDAALERLAARDPLGHLSIKYSHPLPVLERWQRDWGTERLARLCAANQEEAPLSIRVNTLKISVEGCRELLSEQGVVTGKLTRVPEELVILEHEVPLDSIPSFRDGYWLVQDASSAFACHLLGVSGGAVVADVCAAPGGKTTHLAALMRNSGRIYAIDSSAERMELLRENCERLGVRNVEPVVGEVAEVAERLAGQCDCVLLDAPCSGSGTIRRHPEIRWSAKLVDEGELRRLHDFQLELLRSSARLLREGGYLVYCTCSIERLENEGVVNDFLEKPPKGNGWRLVEAAATLDWAAEYMTGEGLYRIFPGQEGMDGFTIARLMRVAT